MTQVCDEYLVFVDTRRVEGMENLFEYSVFVIRHLPANCQ